jgi:seryl-tRNA synthetase
MIDIKFLRENPDVVRASQKGRGEDVTLVDQVIAIDEKRRAAINEFELLRAEQNTLSKSVGGAKGDEKAKLLESAKDLANMRSLTQLSGTAVPPVIPSTISI